MTEVIAATLADHGARITNSEKELSSISSKLDRMTFFILTTLVTSIGGLLAVLLTHK